MRHVSNWSRNIPLVVFLGILVFASTHLLNTTWLGWFDSRAVNVLSVHAVTRDGRDVRLPNNYFLAHSFDFTSDWLMDHKVIEPDGIFFPTGNWGSTLNPDIMRRANACTVQAPTIGSKRELQIKPHMKKFLKQYHRYVLSQADQNGRFSFDVYPHHLWSNPFVFDEVYELDVRMIVAYRFRLEATCVDFIDGKVVAQRFGGIDSVFPVAER